MRPNRRQFVQAVSAGAALSSRLLQAADNKPAAAFTLGLGTYTFRNQDVPGLIERCRDLNLRTIELSHPRYMLPQANISEFSAVRQQLTSGGIDLRSWFCGDLSKAADVDRMREGARLFGVKTVSGSATHELLDAVNEACSKGGFRFGIHNHYFANRKFMYESPDDVLNALRGRPNLFSTFDTGHMIACGFDPTDAYEKLKAHIRIIHLKDEDAPGHGVIMGEGKGNLAKFLRTISNDRFSGLAAIEYEEGTDPKNEVAQCVAFVRDHVSLKTA